MECLQISAEDGYGPGTVAALGASGVGFGIIIRTLDASRGSGGGGSCLRGLRELSVSKIGIEREAAAGLADALRGHPSLVQLELWNVDLDDECAVAVASLAAPEGAAALQRLNMGRNLISGAGRDKIESLVDRGRVNVRIY